MISASKVTSSLKPFLHVRACMCAFVGSCVLLLLADWQEAIVKSATAAKRQRGTLIDRVT